MTEGVVLFGPESLPSTQHFKAFVEKKKIHFIVFFFSFPLNILWNIVNLIFFRRLLPLTIRLSEMWQLHRVGIKCFLCGSINTSLDITIKKQLTSSKTFSTSDQTNIQCIVVCVVCFVVCMYCSVCSVCVVGPPEP